MRAIIEYAIDQGVALQMGEVPPGERLLPTEVSNVSCAEAMQMALKFHPDWIPWIDHSTTPPTINITPIGEATAAAFTVGSESAPVEFEVVAREDLLPESVRIVYESASEIDGEVYRAVYVDKFPADGPDGGPQVLTASIPLEGMRSQIQKSRIQSRTLPATQATAKAWLKEKFPQIATIPDADLFVPTWSLELVTEDDADFPPAVSPQATRLGLTSLSQATHELVRGTIEDWMRRRVGPVRVYFKVIARPTVSEALKAECEALPSSLIVTATNAVTKTYKSISHWSPAEDVPTGIAQSVYTALHAAMPLQGSITIEAEDIPAVPYHGRVVSLPPQWPDMAAPVHSVDWDVESGRMTLGFGPAPHLAPADFLEMQRILRARPVTWWSFDERDSGQLGYDAGPSAQGDTVAGFETPKSEPAGRVSPAGQFQISEPFQDATDDSWHVRVEGGWVLCLLPEPGAADPMDYTEVAAEADLTIASGDTVYCRVITDKNDVPTSALLDVLSTVPTTIHAQPDPGGNTGNYYYRLGTFGTVGGAVVLTTHYHRGGPIIHRPSRNNRNLKITIKHFIEDTGALVPNGSDTFLFFRQGLYVGDTDPGDGATQDEVTVTESLPES